MPRKSRTVSENPARSASLVPGRMTKSASGIWTRHTQLPRPRCGSPHMPGEGSGPAHGGPRERPYQTRASSRRGGRGSTQLRERVRFILSDVVTEGPFGVDPELSHIRTCPRAPARADRARRSRRSTPRIIGCPITVPKVLDVHGKSGTDAQGAFAQAVVVHHLLRGAVRPTRLPNELPPEPPWRRLVDIEAVADLRGAAEFASVLGRHP